MTCVRSISARRAVQDRPRDGRPGVGGAGARASSPTMPSGALQRRLLLHRVRESHERAIDLLERTVLPGSANRVWIEHDTRSRRITRPCPTLQAYMERNDVIGRPPPACPRETKVRHSWRSSPRARAARDVVRFIAGLPRRRRRGRCPIRLLPRPMPRVSLAAYVARADATTNGVSRQGPRRRRRVRRADPDLADLRARFRGSISSSCCFHRRISKRGAARLSLHRRRSMEGGVRGCTISGDGAAAQGNVCSRGSRRCCGRRSAC
jgi:hypothetical protein